MTSIGPRYPGATSDNSAIGTAPWSSTDNLIANDSVFSQVYAVTSGQVSHYAVTQNYGFSGISGSGTITGVKVEIPYTAGADSDFKDTTVKLMKGGTIQGSNLATNANTGGGGYVQNIKSYGADGEMWGLSLTPSDVMASNFGVAFSLTAQADTVFMYCDFVRITVYYVTGPTYTDAPVMRVACAITTNDVWANLTNIDTPVMRIGIADQVTDDKASTDTATMRIGLTSQISELVIRARQLLIRERPPLRLVTSIETPDGVYRWAADEPKAANSPSNISFSSTMPGGYETFSGVLARASNQEYPDLAEFSTITVRGLGGLIAWQGRLETTPRTSGDQMSVSPGAVGWQSALQDDQSARMIYVDINMSTWGAMSIQRTLDYISAGIDQVGSSVNPDVNSGYPALTTGFTGAWARSSVSEAWFDAKEIPLGSLYAAWRQNGNISGGGWGWGMALSDDDRGAGTAFNDSGLTTATPGALTLSAIGSTRKWACVHLETSTVNENQSGVEYLVYWTCLGVYGLHNLTKRGYDGDTTAKGFYASDIVKHAVSTWAPEITFTTGTDGTIQTTDYFIIPHASWMDPTTASAIITEVSKYNLEDWAVWDGPTMWFYPRGQFGQRWRATIGPANLSEAGAQVDRLWNSVIVRYNDVTGVTRTIGPPGSNAASIDASLADSDPLNPVTLAGLNRRAMLTMGVATEQTAVAVGQAFLAEQKLLSTAGQAKLVGYVLDDRGVLWPAWRVKSGDYISFTDAAETGYRRITKASWDDNSKVLDISLDSPPEGLAALLERLQVVLTPIGF